MKRILRMLAAAGPFAVALVAGPPAVAQKHRRRCTARDNQPRGKSGGILRVPGSTVRQAGLCSRNPLSRPTDSSLARSRNPGKCRVR